MKGFKGVWISYEILTDEKLSDKEKIIYSMIDSLSKENECVMSNAYIGNLLNISKGQVSRIVNSLKKKGFIKIRMTYKENSKEIALRRIVPMCKNDNTYMQDCTKPIVKSVKDIINNNKIDNINKKHNTEERDYSKFDWSSLYANNRN